ncbi:MAG TPA: hypothetical protein PKU83_00725 [Chryseolinea sp.]|nr:hypothetical protein [Chryseolinea sp.]
MQGCICAGAGKSTGRPGCTTPRGITTYLVIGHWKNDSGNINSIPQGTVIDQTYVEGRLNNLNMTERLFVLPAVKRVKHNHAPDVTEDVGNGLLIKTGEKGVRTNTYELIKGNATEEMLEAINSHLCSTLGFFELTNFGQIAGTNIGDGDLRLTKIADDTFLTNLMYPEEGVAQKIMLSFIVDETEDLTQQDYITAESIEYATRFWYDSQPQQVLITEVLSTSLTDIKVKLSWMRVRFENDGITDFVSNDFNAGGGVATINNLTQSTTPAVVASESALPNEEGVYTLTFAGAADEDEVEIGIVKDGYYADKIRVFVGPTS